MEKAEIPPIKNVGPNDRKIWKFLGTIDNLVRYERTYPNWKHPLITYAMEKVLEKSQDFILEGLIGTREALPFDKIERQISLEKTHFCWTSGRILVNHRRQGGLLIDIDYYNDDFENSFTMGFIIKNGMEELIKEFFQKVDAWIKENNFYRGAAITPDGDFINVKKYSWDDLVVEEKIKKEIHSNITDLINNQKLYQKYKIQTKRGILISGAAGNGKSLCGKIIANQLKCSFLWAPPKFIQNAKSISHIYQFAREISPTIIYFEDVDLFAGDREKEDNRSATLGQLLNEMDGIVENDSVVTIMTTNFPDKIEKALKGRPGRFDRHIKFFPPKTTQRVALLKLLSKDCETEINWESIAEKTQDFSGAHLTEVINLAKMSALEESSIKNDKIFLTQKLLEKSVTTIQQHFDDIVKKTLGFVSPENEEEIW